MAEKTPVGEATKKVIVPIEVPTMDLVLVIDATGSMGSTLVALKPVLSQICKLLPLFVKARFHLIIYRDFDCQGDSLYKYHGSFVATDVSNMIQVITNTSATGGGDSEECQKYAFNRLLDDIPDGKIVVFHFTDASPHRFPFPAHGNDNHAQEGRKLKINGMEPDWVNLCNVYKARGIPIYTIGVMDSSSFKYYSLLAHMTGGALVLLKDAQSDKILKTTTIVFSRALGYEECDLTGLASLIKLGDCPIPTTENSNEFTKLVTETLEFSPNAQNPVIAQAANVCTRTILENRYRTDPAFQILCFNVFVDIIKDGHILALTYNPLLGCLYRNMCRRSKIAPLEAKRDELMNLMSKTMGQLKTTNNAIYEQVSLWMEASYNRIEEINELIGNSAGPMIPFLTLQTVDRMTKKDLTNACKIPMPQNLRLLGTLISSIVLNEKKPKNMPEVFVPLSMNNDDVFCLLSHLMCPGVKIDFKPSIVVALVTLRIGNAILAPRALDYLREKIGTWFDTEAAEWHLFGIIKMILKLETEYGGIITPQELAYMKPLFIISAAKYNNLELDCKRKFRLEPEHGKKYCDHKALCLKCNQFRSLSVMTEAGCGLCLSYTKDVLDSLTDPDKTHSYLFNCGICTCLYAVRNLEGLKAKPKCHYCRQEPPTEVNSIPKVICTVCNIGMILPEDNKYNTGNDFMCSLCVENGGVPRIETLQVKMHDLLLENPELIAHLTGLKITHTLLTNRDSLFSLKGKFTIAAAEEQTFNGPLLCNKRLLENTAEILEKIRNIILKGNVDTETCIVCYSDFVHHDLESLCFHKDCRARSCKPCIQKWFSENKPGQRVLENRLNCPSCKRIPIKGIAFMNPYLKELFSQKVVFDADWHYAWCKNCGKVKEYMERQCAGPDPMEINNFMCEDCMKPGEHKACPFCKVPTVKMSGCDHMECPTQHGGCGIHWCYRCEGPAKDIFHANNSKDVYDHLHDVHGNIWGAGEEDPDSDADE